MIIKADKAGTLIEFVNDNRNGYLDIVYASATAPNSALIEVMVNDQLFDAVHVGLGASHSWWANAGGKMLPTAGLKPKDKLTITTTGQCALRIDFTGDIPPALAKWAEDNRKVI